MPTSTIPYDPSLVLGMVIDPGKIKVLEQIAELQKPVDAARDRMNALMRQKLSLDLTMRELISLKATPEQLEPLSKEIDEIMKSLVASAGDLGTSVIESEKAIVAAKEENDQEQIGTQIQSPLDFSASKLEKLPLSSDTMDMDVQYFRFESEKQKNNEHASAVSGFVGAKVTAFLGAKIGAQASHSSHETSSRATERHGLEGTIVIVANCTHRMAQVFTNTVLDVENAIENYVAYTKKPWKKQNVKSMLKLAKKKITPEDQASGMPVLVGESYGSSFVGFIHLEKVEQSDSYQKMQSSANAASVSIESGMFLGGSEGSFGLDQQSSDSIKDMLSTSTLQSHCSLITMGLIPSIKSNNVTTTIQKLKGTPKEHMEQLAAMQNASNSGMSSAAKVAAASKQGNSMEQMSSDFIKASVDAIGSIDTKNNKVIDMNSMMTALDDYIAKAGSGITGVPINFYLKYITQRTIAVQWLEKYYPDQLHEAIKKEEDKDNDNDNDDSGDEDENED